MKKIIASAVGLMLVGGVAATTASAVESQFGGYWRTRAYFEENFKAPNGLGDNDSAEDFIDTRTRLFYTAKFSDDLKLVNKFEFNTGWGDSVGGDIGADGKGNWRIKNSYADFNLGVVNTKVGIQPITISRGFIMGDDLTGVLATADFGMVKVPFLYSTLSNQDWEGNGWDGANAADVTFTVNDPENTTALNGADQNIHLLSVMPEFNVNDNVKLTPNLTYVNVTEQDTYLYYLGFDADMKFDTVTAWFTGFYNGGEVDQVALGGVEDADVNGYLVAAGADAGIIHGQAFYSSGQDVEDDGTVGDEIDAVVLPGGDGTGASYYWSEILGLGVFDNTVDGTLGDKISNIWAVNLGVSLAPMDKMTFDFDVWYAQLAEDVLRDNDEGASFEDELGIEFDAKLSYELMENLSADFIFAYLIAGDAIGDDDIMEGGLQLSLKF